MPYTIPAGHESFATMNPDGTLTVTLTIPAVEKMTIAGHSFAEVRNFLAPREILEARFRYGGRMINDRANSAAKEWRAADPSREGETWPRKESDAFRTAYESGTLLTRTPVDPVMGEARKMALSYIVSRAGVSMKDAPRHEAAGKYFRETKAGFIRDDTAVDAFIHRFDAAQSANPDLGFIARARDIIATRNATPIEVDIDI